MARTKVRHMPTRGAIMVSTGDGGWAGMVTGPTWSEQHKADMIAIYQEINPDSVVMWQSLPCYCAECERARS